MKGLLGQPGVGGLELGVGDGVEAEGGIKFLAERGWERACLAGRGRAPAPDGVGDLARPIRGLATIREPRLEDARLQARQAWPRIAVRARSGVRRGRH